MKYCPATLAHIDALNALEKSAFEGDRISPRQMRRFVQSPHDCLILALDGDVLAGYALVLFNRGTHLARLYSLAVSPDYRGQGLSRELMRVVEKIAVEKGYITLRLEVRNDNEAARSLYQKLGYKVLKSLVHYYDDLADGVRMHKRLEPPGPSITLPMPLYVQTTPFTCGPACLQMAFAALRESIPPSRLLELQLWREATTIYMTSGHGGCSAEGLALAAINRGFSVELFSQSHKVPFIDSVRDENKKAIISLVYDDFVNQLMQKGVTANARTPSLDELEQFLRGGAAVLLLISTYRFNGEKGPHWIILSGCNDSYFFFHDPFVEHAKDAVAAAYVPVSRAELAKVMGFGRKKQTACVVLFPDKAD
ncbi:GNAT family N-acetyltransferase/peptidase C39 family protein [Shewanella sp.]|uniref:GNAT family N-acetyltransferase/peptidase C39 family protein n=1 Tax=Shewanella sp. TaxID=50422 RepID=UPI00356ADE06